MNKRGELSMEVIIIAAIALLVLVILAVLVIRAGGKVGDECANVGGQCRFGDKFSACDESLGEFYSPNNCPTDKICCVGRQS